MVNEYKYDFKINVYVITDFDLLLRSSYNSGSNLWLSLAKDHFEEKVRECNLIKINVSNVSEEDLDQLLLKKFRMRRKYDKTNFGALYSMLFGLSKGSVLKTVF